MTTITTVTVFHPMHKEINSGYTIFQGPSVHYEINEVSGTLEIYDWETSTEEGYATFARGSWAYTVQSEPKKDSK